MPLTSISRMVRRTRWPYAVASALAPACVLANPTGAQVVAGQVGISTPDANTLVVNQGSSSAIINWQQFSIGSGEYVYFNQPNASAAVLNRVVGGNPSQILGQLSANGRVFIINPQGVMFGAGSRVDVGSLVASTADIADGDFLSGRYVFAGSSGSGSVVNAGTLQASDGGFVVLAGDSVRNSGLIQARLGDVVLASGSALTLQTDASGLVSFAIDRATVADAAGVSNTGDILASGGSVLLSADLARTLVGTAVNNSGRISAQSIQDHAGSIVLTAAGGDVVQGGLLDASGTGGADGGNIRLTSDGDVSLTSTSRTLATGAAGGDVRAIAGDTLSYARGARIDVAAGSLAARGGFAELSGQRVTLGDIVNLGRNGHLLIDPTDFVIGPSQGDSATSASQATLESQLRSGGDVTISASNSISFDALSGGLLDGHNASGTGGGLFLFGGSIFFANTSDTVKVDGDLYLQAGTDHSIIVGNLVSLDGDVEIEGGAVSSGMPAGTGNITTGNLSAESVITVFGNADVVTGGLSAVSSDGGVALVQVSGVDIDVRGDVNVSGGGQSFAGGYPGIAGAWFTATASGATLNLRGNVDVHANAFSYSFSDSTGSESGSRGDAFVALQAAGSIDVGGHFNVQAVGDSDVFIATTGANTGAGNVTLHGPTAIGSSAATRDFTDPSGVHDVERYGSATLNAFLGVGSRFDASGLSVSGPTADVYVDAGDIRLHGGAGNDALVVSALTGNAGNYFLRQRNGTTLVESSYGTASVYLGTTLGDASSTSIAVDGRLSVSGPSAFLHLCGPGLMLIGNTASGGNLEVLGSGWTIDGDWTQLDYSHSPGSGQAGVQLASSLGYGTTPVLTQGFAHWGDAALEVNDGSGNASAGALHIGGNLVMSGIGQVSADIRTDGLTVGGVGTTGPGIFLDARSLGPGQVLGTLVATVADASFNVYQVSRQISDGSGGAATYGHARFVFDGTSTADINGGKLSVTGLTAEAVFDTARDLGFSTIEVLGTQGAGGARYADTSTFTPVGTGPAIGPTSTTIVGGENVLAFGLGGGVHNLSASSITVTGNGAAALVGNVAAANVGAVTVTAGAGQISTNDPTVVPSGNFTAGGDAFLGLSSTSPVVASSVHVDAAGQAHVGGSYTVSGAFHLASGAGHGIDQILAADFRDFVHPLQSGFFFPTANVNFAPLRVNAGSIDIGFSADSTLFGTSLSATNALSLNGGTAKLQVGNGTLSGGTLTAIANLQGNQVTLRTTSGALLVSGGVTGNHVTFDSAGTLSTGTGSLTVNAAALDAIGTDILFGNAAINVGNGLATNGNDPLLLQGLAQHGVTPPTNGPNAAFVARNGVTIGSLHLAAGYLYVRAHSAALNSVGTNGTFFYNYRPFLNTETISFSGFNPPSGNTTFVFGGSDFQGDVRFSIPPAKLRGNENYVMMTTGDILGLSTLHTSGQVLVLQGVVVTPPPPPQAPPDDAGEATDAQLVTSDMFDNPYAGTGIDSGEPLALVSLVDEESSAAVEDGLSCR